MTAPRLTFAIPFYRDLPYLERALDSIGAQSFDEWQAVVCDDAGPEPGAADLVARYSDPRIRYVRNAVNLGLARNWNRCLEVSPTDLVTVMHADDELEPGYAGAVVAAHDRHPRATAVYTRTSIIDARGQPTFSLVDLSKRFIEPCPIRDAVVEGENGLVRMMRGSFIFCPTLCYRRSMLGDLRFEDRWRFVVDLELIADLLLGGHRVVGLRDRLYRYRRHAASQTARLTVGTERFREEIAIHDEIADRAERVGWHHAARTARRMPTVRAHLLLRIAVDLARGQGDAARAKLGLLRGASSTKGSRW